MKNITLNITGRNIDPVYEIKLKRNKAVTGYIEMSDKGEYLHIGNIKILEKGEGHGRLIINDLLEEYSTLHGNSLYNSIGFWEKMGAEFVNKPIPGVHYGMNDGNFEFLIRLKNNEVVSKAAKIDKMDLFSSEDKDSRYARNLADTLNLTGTKKIELMLTYVSEILAKDIKTVKEDSKIKVQPSMITNCYCIEICVDNKSLDIPIVTGGGVVGAVSLLPSDFNQIAITNGSELLNILSNIFKGIKFM